MSEPSCAPEGRFIVTNHTIRLSARSTPGTERTRLTSVSGKVCAKSTLGVLREVTQRSASMCSMVIDALSRSPRKRPTWTNTSVTAKATPDTVIRNRSLSWSRLLVARSATSLLLGRQTADHSLDDQVGGFLRRAYVDPIVVALGDRERDRAVAPGPGRLRHEIRVGQLGAEATCGDSL